MDSESISIVVVRPDGYVGSIVNFDARSLDAGARAAHFLDDYFDAFLQAT